MIPYPLRGDIYQMEFIAFIDFAFAYRMTYR